MFYHLPYASTRLITIILVLAFISTNGQNLIPNPGFDEHVQCPDGPSQIELAAPWTSAGANSSDLLDTCWDLPQLGYFSYQEPRSGTGAASILVYRKHLFVTNSEFLQVPLMSGLKIDVNYYIQFYVNLVDQLNWPIDAVGLGFSDTLVNRELGQDEIIGIEPAIENRGTLITDTIGWTRISGCYRAKGDEDFALIGNFRSQEETLTLDPDAMELTQMLIEDVFVGEFDPLRDTMILCRGEELILDATFLDATYKWSSGEVEASIRVSEGGQYLVSATIGNCVLGDSVWIIEEDQLDQMIGDTTTCLGQPVDLIAPLIGQYVWSTGDTTRGIIVQESGLYQVDVENRCGQFSFSSIVDYQECKCAFFVPNAFTPNGDGLNDCLGIFPDCTYDYEVGSFKVFNRFGDLIYDDRSNRPCWDGRYKGSQIPMGVYIWVLEYSYSSNGLLINQNLSGDVTILH